MATSLLVVPEDVRLPVLLLIFHGDVRSPVTNFANLDVTVLYNRSTTLAVRQL